MAKNVYNLFFLYKNFKKLKFKAILSHVFLFLFIHLFIFWAFKTNILDIIHLFYSVVDIDPFTTELDWCLLARGHRSKLYPEKLNKNNKKIKTKL